MSADPIRHALVVIDPGHGGQHDVGRSTALGVRGPGGTAEKDLTLHLARLVSQRLGGRVELTRTSDTNLRLGARAEKAKQHDADVFISLHANDGGGQRGAEAWVHDRAGASSQRLALLMQRELGRLGGASLRRGPMAVLHPTNLGGRTAACLLEVDQLGDGAGERRLRDPGHLDRLASAIAAGVRSFLGDRSYGGAAARALDGFDDADQEFDNNRRAADIYTKSSKEDAQRVIEAFRSSTVSSPWRTLDREQVAQRLSLIVDFPTVINQAGFNLCGPAVFTNVWATRDPLAFATFATKLFDQGRAKIGSSYEVAPSAALTQADFGAMMDKASSKTDQADWMFLGALRNNEDALVIWEGDPGQKVAGITFPEEVMKWLKATGIYKKIDNQIGGSLSCIGSNGYVEAEKLEVHERTDTIILIQTKMITGRVPSDILGKLLLNISNHWLVLNGPVIASTAMAPAKLPEAYDDALLAYSGTPPYEPVRRKRTINTGEVCLNVWQYGRNEQRWAPSVKEFGDNYYGAIICTLTD